MVADGGRFELGRGVSGRFVRDDRGREIAIEIEHRARPSTRCRAVYLLEGAAGDAPDDPTPRVRIEQRDPLTLDRPLGCARCGTVGWVIEGHWSEDGRRLTLRRHPTTTWSRGAEHSTTIDVRPADPDRFVTEWISS